MRWALVLALLSTSALASRADRLSVSPRLDRRDRLGASSAASPILLSLSLLPPDSECSGTAPDGVTFTRASGATCIASTGIAYALAANQARATNAGLLVEGAATNAVLHSRSVVSIPWTGTGCLATATGMDGSTLVGRCTGPTVITQTLSVAAGSRSASAYVRRQSGLCSVQLAADSETTSKALVSGWERLTLPYTSDASVALSITIPSGCVADVDYVQDEAGSIATSPAVSAGTAATRAGERALVPSAGLSEMKGCAALSFAPDWSVSPPDPPMSGGYYALSGFENVGMNRLLYANPTSTTVAAYGGSAATTAQANTVYAAGVAQRYVSQWDASTPVQTVCSESACSNAPGPFAGYPVFGSELYLGSRSTSLAHVYGYLSNLVIGNTVEACQ